VRGGPRADPQQVRDRGDGAVAVRRQRPVEVLDQVGVRGVAHRQVRQGVEVGPGGPRHHPQRLGGVLSSVQRITHP
jgi:hypothetical protein